MGSGGNGFAFAQTCRHAPIICPQGTLAMMQAANLSATRLGILLLAPERRLPPEMRVPGHKSSHKKKCLQFWTLINRDQALPILLRRYKHRYHRFGLNQRQPIPVNRFEHQNLVRFCRHTFFDELATGILTIPVLAWPWKYSPKIIVHERHEQILFLINYFFVFFVFFETPHSTSQNSSVVVATGNPAHWILRLSNVHLLLNSRLLFLGNALTREARLTLLTTNG